MSYEMKINTIYETPTLRFYDMELEGFLCQSGFKVQVDRWDSVDGGNIDFDDDAVYLGE